MMRRGPTFWGAAVGVLAALLLIITLRPHPLTTGPMLGEQGGAIGTLVLQYTHGAEFVWPVYRQFLVQQAAGVTVYVACPDEADFDELRAALGPVPCVIKPIYTRHVMTAWARDRWVQLLPATPGAVITLLAPQGELQQEIWPQRAGDSHVAQDVATALAPAVSARRSTLYFDGGDFLCDGPWVFVTPAVLQRNLQHTVRTREELIQAIQFDLHRQPVLLDDAPDHHAGMYMMAAGTERMVVGDPSLGAKLLAPASADGLDGGPDFTSAMQRRFDSVAKLAADHGYHVYRIPTVPALHGKMYLTYVNVILDERAGKPVVYMPIYEGQEKMNAAAQGVWEALGYTVRPIDCTSEWQRGGTLHCLVNVLQRRTGGV